MVMGCVPVRIAESAIMQLGCKVVGGLGREEDGLGRVDVDMLYGVPCAMVDAWRRFMGRVMRRGWPFDAWMMLLERMKLTIGGGRK